MITVAEPTVGTNATAAEEASSAIRLAHQIQDKLGRAVDYETLHDSDPAHGILDFTERADASLIAMTTHGRTGLRRVAVGSVAMQVVHLARCPVLLAPADDAAMIDDA